MRVVDEQSLSVPVTGNQQAIAEHLICTKPLRSRSDMCLFLAYLFLCLYMCVQIITKLCRFVLCLFIITMYWSPSLFISFNYTIIQAIAMTHEQDN